ncbi:MAG: hypothetical protein GY820_35950 [Gammaproteobacteria bacterium]|nr:hypothetical protein [Gammaproteobacteria bacterium]
MKILCLALLCILISACATNKHHTVDNITITEIGQDGKEHFCHEFSLDESGIGGFFRAARHIGRKEYHDDYDHIACFVKGTLDFVNAKKNMAHCEFTVRAGATAELWCDDGEYYVYVCDTCDALFGGS